MKALLLTKRQYTNRDLLDDRYGRLWELPKALAEMGHDVHGMALSYARRADGATEDLPAGAHGHLTWHSYSAGKLDPVGFARYARRALSLARTTSPDVVIASSDTHFIILGAWLARRLGVGFVADLYDNYESFASARFPGILPMFRRSVRLADGVVCVSEPLREHVQRRYGRTRPTVVVENAIARDVFRARDRAASRGKFGLPPDARIIGTAGALSHTRNIGVLFDAFAILADRRPDLHLAVAGPRDVDVPAHPRIHDLGVIDWREDVPDFLCALDVGIICNRDTPFGRYCFPQKAFEILGCGVPVCAASVGAMERLFSDCPQCLFKHDSAESLAAAVTAQLDDPRKPDIPIPGWDDLGRKLEAFLLALQPQPRG